MKRFTETDKWRDSWFRKLSPDLKLGFFYLVENCDAAGVWDPDYDLANFAIGQNVDWDGLHKALGDRVKKLSSGKWHVIRFVEFQYGNLSPECRPHVKIISLLKGYQIPYKKNNNRVSDRVPATHNTGRRQEEDKDNKGNGPEEIYAAYPRKEAKQSAIKAIVRAIEGGIDPEFLLMRTKTYAAAVSRWSSEDRQYIPHPATWFNRGSYEDDPQSWERATRQPNGRPQVPDRLLFEIKADASDATE